MLFAALLPASRGLAVPKTAVPYSGDDMATRLNEATMERGIGIAISALRPLAQDVELNDTFLGKRDFFAGEPHRPEYMRLGKVEDAIADRTNPVYAYDHASVRVATAATSVSSNIVQDPAVMVGATFGGVSGSNTQPGERSEQPPQPAVPPPPFELDAAPLPSATVATATPQATVPQLARPVLAGAAVAGGTVASGTVASRTVASGTVGGRAVVSGTIAGGTGGSGPARSRSGLLAGADTAGNTVSEAVQSNFVQAVLARNQYFPGDARLSPPMLVETFVLAPSEAIDQVADGESISPVPTVALPLKIFPAVDQAVPPTAGILRNTPSGISVLDWPMFILQALRQMSGPEIVSIIIATGGVFGLAQVWRRRRRPE